MATFVYVGFVMKFEVVCVNGAVVAKDILGLALELGVGVRRVEIEAQGKIVVDFACVVAEKRQVLLAKISQFDGVESVCNVEQSLPINLNSFENFFGSSPQIKQVIEQAKKMAQLHAPLLIQGETGTGKEILARACHACGDKKDAPFVALNCASLPDDVAESEMFGGSIENSNELQRGVLEAANGGTVFLDEIGEMSRSLQVKLLRFLQDGTFRRVGEDQEIKVDVRVICATQKNISELVAQGVFREDLYYRLNVLALVVPALKERRSDILPLAEHFIVQNCQKYNRSIATISDSCKEYMLQYSWPGNVRQLENTIYRAVSLLDGDELQVEDLRLPDFVESQIYLPDHFDGSLDEQVKRFESNLLKRLYPEFPSTRQLAKKLGVSHTAIANKLREYGIGKTKLS